MPPSTLVVQANSLGDLRAGTIWWRRDGRSEVVVIKHVEDLSRRIYVQYLNNRRYKRIFPTQRFEQEWTFLPRIDLTWLNTGSIWQRICYQGHKEDRKRYTLSVVRNGRVVLFEGIPGKYREVSTGLSSRPNVLNFTLNHVRLWPADEPFPRDPEPWVPPKKRQPKASKPSLSLWDRLDGDDIV